MCGNYGWGSPHVQLWISACMGSLALQVLRLNEIKKVLSDIFLFKNLTEDEWQTQTACVLR